MKAYKNALQVMQFIMEGMSFVSKLSIERAYKNPLQVTQFIMEGMSFVSKLSIEGL